MLWCSTWVSIPVSVIWVSDSGEWWFLFVNIINCTFINVLEDYVIENIVEFLWCDISTAIKFILLKNLSLNSLMLYRSIYLERWMETSYVGIMKEGRFCKGESRHFRICVVFRLGRLKNDNQENRFDLGAHHHSTDSLSPTIPHLNTLLQVKMILR